jgi:hypothetical protein
MDMVLDVNVDVYPVEVGEKLVIVIANTLNLDGTPGPSTFDGVSWRADSCCSRGRTGRRLWLQQGPHGALQRICTLCCSL